MLTSCSGLINYLLKTYSIEDIIDDMDTKTLQFTQLSNLTPTGYAEDRWNQALHCNLVYDEYVLKRIFVEELHGIYLTLFVLVLELE